MTVTINSKEETKQTKPNSSMHNESAEDDQEQMINRVIELAMIGRVQGKNMAHRISNVMRENLPSSKGPSTNQSVSSLFEDEEN
jgi:hypothetical protein